MALVCPLYFAGYVNGMFLYYAERCSDQAYMALYSSSSIPTTTCPGNSTLCQDDGTLNRSASSDPFLFRDTADKGAPDYLSPTDPFPETPGVIDKLDENFCVFNDSRGQERICRLFLVRVRAKHTLYFRVGFELKPGTSVSAVKLEKPVQLGAKTYEGEFGAIPFVIFLAR